jgi:hypothetical protein
MLTEVKVWKHHGFLLQYSGEVLPVRWGKEELDHRLLGRAVSQDVAAGANNKLSER